MLRLPAPPKKEKKDPRVVKAERFARQQARKIDAERTGIAYDSESEDEEDEIVYSAEPSGPPIVVQREPTSLKIMF
jgi:hypothetical protein